SRSVGNDAAFRRAVLDRTGLEVEFADTRQVVEMSDILVTVTPAVAPLFDAHWVKPGTHISAMGSDNIGKRELPLAIFERGTFIMDYPAQSMVLGEAQHVLAAGMIAADVL